LELGKESKMKKGILFLMAIVIFFVFGYFSVSMAAENYPARKVFFGVGEIQKSIPYSFKVPTGNCGGVKTYQFVPGSSFWGVKGEWKLLSPGTTASQGVYRFINEDTGCSTRFDVEGEVPWARLYESFSFREIEPSDVGLLVNNRWKANNFFRLATDDMTASFYLLQPNFGMNLNIAVINNHPYDFIYYQGYLYGVIICDGQGFLKKYISGDALTKQADQIWIADDDVVILEFRGEYNKQL
jgi:hypothetical protein